MIFVCTDSTEIFFSKLRSAGLNYYLTSFFTDSYCGGGYLISIAYCSMLSLCPILVCNHLNGEERELAALLCLSSLCLVIVVWLFLSLWCHGSVCCL